MPFVEARPSLAGLQPYVQAIWQSLVFDRKGAATVNREFLGWLSRRAEPTRPFFAFLNYSDAHTPYELEAGRIHRFGVSQPDERQREMIRRWGDLDKIRLAPKDLPLAVDAYDDCIADLDEQVGKLLDKLRRQGVLDRTWLIIAADHGESFGEHAGIFCHGTSLYQTELHVPLLIVPPGGVTGHVVKETVSLRDLAATVVDVLDLEAGSPFPGSSLARYWDGKPTTPTPTRASSDPALLSGGPPRVRDQCRRSRSTQEDRGRSAFPQRRRLVVHPPRGNTCTRNCSAWAGTPGSSTTWPAIPPRGRSSSGCVRPWPDSREGHSCRRDSIVEGHARREIRAAVNPQTRQAFSACSCRLHRELTRKLLQPKWVSVNILPGQHAPYPSAGLAQIAGASNPASDTEPVRSDTQHQL